jgi:hypothetical protein
LNTDRDKPMSKRRIRIGAAALALGGLAPLLTGVVGLHGYFTKGLFVAKNGEVVTGVTAWIASGAFIMAGLGMIALAAWQYRRRMRHRIEGPEGPDSGLLL